jgi:hypothetical protein
MYFLNLSNGIWVLDKINLEKYFFVRFQSNHLQGVKYFDLWDYNLVFYILLGRTVIFDGTV